MNVKTKSDKMENPHAPVPRVKTLDLWLTVTDRDLEKKVKRAFALAKSGGRELDLTFSPGTP